MSPPALANSQKDLSKIGARMGMVFSLMGIGSLGGAPVAGALIQKQEGDYLYAQMFGGSVMVCGALMLMIPRVLSVGWSPAKTV